MFFFSMDSTQKLIHSGCNFQINHLKKYCNNTFKENDLG